MIEVEKTCAGQENKQDHHLLDRSSSHHRIAGRAGRGVRGGTTQRVYARVNQRTKEPDGKDRTNTKDTEQEATLLKRVSQCQESGEGDREI